MIGSNYEDENLLITLQLIEVSNDAINEVFSGHDQAKF